MGRGLQITSPWRYEYPVQRSRGFCRQPSSANRRGLIANGRGQRLTRWTPTVSVKRTLHAATRSLLR